MFNGKETEPAKRKQAGDDAVSGRQKQKKARDDKGDETAVKDDEVEEFFAILRRIHVAVTYFKNADGDGCKLTDGGSKLRAMLECNEEGNGVKGGSKREEGVEENVGLDLNADPDPDPESDPS